MDTLTHGVLGACLGELLGGRQLGRKALLAGAIAQNLPDADVVCALWLDPAANVLAHRGLTHSFFFAVLITPLLAYGLTQWRYSVAPFSFWLKFLGAQIFVHDLMDGFNAYGTGWFEPFSHLRVSFHTLFVSDPLFFIPLVLGTGYLLLAGNQQPRRNWYAGLALGASGLYLAGCVWVKERVYKDVAAAISKQELVQDNYLITPTPFNSLLWFITTKHDSGSWVGYRSVWDRHPDIHFEFFPRNDSLLQPSTRTKEIENLRRFSQGYYTVEQSGDTLVWNDLRFGQMMGWQHPRTGFVFHYYLAPEIDNTVVLQRGRFAGWDETTLPNLISRIRGR